MFTVIKLSQEEKDWYLDNDNDGYHTRIERANQKPGDKWKLFTKGVDCDDTKPAVHSLNSCGKCRLEPRLKTWTADNLEQNATGLLKEMIDRARALVPNLDIVKANNQKVGAGTSIPCDRIIIGGGINNVTANSALAFELSHVINRAQDISLRNRLFTGISRNEFVNRSLEIEAEGSLFASIIRKRETSNQNDCETRNLQINLTNNPVNAHSGMSLAQIKSDIRSSGELEQRRNELQNSGISTNTLVSASKKYEDVYNQTINFINYYRRFEGETDQQIKARLARNNNCN